MPKDPASIPGMSKSPGSTTKLYQSYQTTRPSPLSKNVSTGVDMFSFLQQANGASPSTAPGSGYNSVQVSPLLSASQPGSPSRAKAPPNAPNRMGANNLSGYGSHLNLFGLGNGGNSSSSAVAASTSAVGVPDLKSPGLSAMAAQLALNGSNGEGSNPPSAAQSANASPNTAAHRRHLMNSLANFSMTPLPPTGPLAAYNPPVSFAQYGQSAAQGIPVTVPGSAYHPIASSAGQGMQTSAGFANTLDAYINTSLPQTTQQGPSAHTDAMAAAMAAAAAAVAASAGPSRSTTATVPVAGRAGTGAYLTPAASADISQEIAKVRAQGLKLQLEGIPENAKSRVETQIKLTLRLLTSDGVPVTCWSHLQLPELLVSREKFRHRLQKVPMNDQSMPSSEQQIVHLEAKVICSNKPTYKIETCLGCIRREYKRSLRRKENRVRSAVQSTCTTPNQSRPSSPTGELLSLGGSNSTGGRLTGNMEVDWDANRIEIEKQRIIIFNCNDLLDFSKGEVSLPTRITCYCRHHGEKIGFCVCLTLKDWKGEVLATTISPPIMITDDHKSTKFKQDRKTRNKSEYDRLGADLSRILPAGGVAPASIPAGNLHVVEGTMGPYKGSRQTMSARNSPSLRPRVGLLDSYSQLASLAGTPSVGNTPIQSPMLGAIHGPNDLASLAAASALSSGSITPHGMINPALSQVMSNPSQLFAISAALGSHGAYNAGSSLNVAVAAPSVPQAQPAGGPSFTPIRRRASTNLGDKAKSQPAQQQPLVTGAFNPSIFNLDGGGGMSLSGSVSHTPVFSQTLQNAQASMHAAQQQQRQNFIPQISQTLQGMSKSVSSTTPSSMSGMPGMNPSASADVQRTGNGASMMAERVVPESGPVAGGIEVTVYGRGFSDSTAVVFGTQLATGVRVLGTQVLTCVLPPSSTAGHARIICYNSNTGLDLRDLNQGLSGRVFNYVEDTDRSLIELVLQIVGLSQTSSKSSAATDAAQLLHSVVDQAEGSQGASEKADTTRKILALAQFQGFPQAVSERNLAQVEAYLVQLFAILLTQNLLLKQDIASTHASTRRNIMHNCALLGMGKLASLLISHASPIDAQDRGGYTPLHFAACFGRIEIAVLLLNYGASPLVKAHSGATPLDLARSNNHDQICLLLQGRDEYASSAIKSEVLGPPPITEAMATAGSMQGRMVHDLRQASELASISQNTEVTASSHQDTTQSQNLVDSLNELFDPNGPLASWGFDWNAFNAPPQDIDETYKDDSTAAATAANVAKHQQ